MTDLYFADLAARSVRYNARDSVEDFDACMETYRLLAERARAEAPCIPDIYYGAGKDERLDLFPSTTPDAPVFVFIHGGYWHSQRKEDACSMAAALTRRGMAVVTVEYTLLPGATLGEAVREVRSAVAWLYRHGAGYGVDPERIFVGGSSAGAHLAGMLVSDSWQRSYRLPVNAVKGALLLSGLYDIRPLCDIYVNEWMRLTREQAGLLSPLLNLPAAGNAPPLLLSVGGKEPEGFRNQTLACYRACRERGIDVRLLADTQNNHFSLVNELAIPESAMTQALLSMAGASLL